MNENEDRFYNEPKALPVFLVLDCSGSMADNGKIDTMNIAVRNFLTELKEAENRHANYAVVIWTFSGNGVNELVPFTKLADFDTGNDLPEMKPYGKTPMGEALRLVKDYIENTDSLRKCARPVILLVSDGMPNDKDWEKSVDDFAGTGRTKRCERYALSIGAAEGTEQYEMLLRFTGDRESICKAEDVEQIIRFFKIVSVSMISRTVSRIQGSGEKIVFEKTETDVSSADDDEDEDDIGFERFSEINRNFNPKWT